MSDVAHAGTFIGTLAGVDGVTIHVDGSGGGGQLVRTALSLSAITGEPFVMERVRSARDDSGLGHQHLAAVRAVAAACDATVAGDELGSETVRFEPERVSGGEIEVTVGTAGSLTLVFDALLPLALALDAPLAVGVADAGTDVPRAPPFDYFRYAKLPLLREFGLAAATDVERRGFYPAGGGAATLALEPTDLDPLALDDRGSIERYAVYSRATTDLRSADVARRQAAHAASALDAESDVAVDYVDAASTGSVLVVVADFERSRAGFGRIGERGRASESIADDVVQRVHAFRGSGAAVDAHLADQLLPFLAVAGGSVAIPTVTDHVETCLDVLDAFERPVTVTERADRVRLEREP